MRDETALRQTLERLDGRGYKAYGELSGSWDVGGFTLSVDHVQGDPYAAPTRLSCRLGPAIAGLPATSFASTGRRVGVAAHLARRFAATARGASKPRGPAGSGEIRMADPGQVVLPQTAVQVFPDGGVEARFTLGLPADGRRIAGRRATEALLVDVPALVRETLLAGSHDEEKIELAAAVNEDADAIRSALPALGLVAFVADDARLPRASGVDPRPLATPDVAPFRSPDPLCVTIDVPNAGSVSGMAVAEGVTLIAGGGFHGKSTLLRAIQDGVWNHPPGDGREQVVTVPGAVKIRAEDGRAVTAVDISAFIDGLPMARDTRRFTSANASGSTSQAAAIVEAIEAGATALLVDEDTSATNFMIRDRRMQALVPPDGEPITPFVDRVRDLHDRLGVSTVLVVGGAGDYLDVADHVVRMSGYRPIDATAEARDIALRLPTGRAVESGAPLERPPHRRVATDSMNPGRGRRPKYVKVPDGRTLLFGSDAIDLAAVEQLAGTAQMRAIGHALAWLADAPGPEGASGRTPGDAPSLPDLLDEAERALADSLDAFDPYRTGELMWFRRFELAAALNRLRSLRVV